MKSSIDKLVLEHLEGVNFKNYDALDVSFCGGLNCFLGLNGQGKTNLLDAIYYLSFTKCFSNPVDSHNIRSGAELFMLTGAYKKGSDAELVQVAVQKGKKKQVRRNKSNYKKFSDHIGFFPLVMLSPEDADLILGGSETRRKFVDGVIAQFDASYLKCLLEYNKVLSQRNAYLKKCAETGQIDQDALNIYDNYLDEHGQDIYEKRKTFIEGFLPLFNEIHQAITPEAEQVGLIYESHLHSARLGKLLNSSQDKDRILRYTSKGVHKDDLTFLLGDQPMKKFGSQGQQKCYLISLKLAQYLYIEEKTSCVPILLLDDVFDKLDSERLHALLQLVGGERFGQTFITDTDIERIEQATVEIGKEKRIFEIHEGQVKSTGKRS